MRDISLGKPSDEYLEPSLTPMMKLFNENNWSLTCSTVLLIVSPLSTPKYTLLTYWQRLIYSIYRCWRTHIWKVSWKSKWSSAKNPLFLKSQKQLCRGVLTKTCSENMQQICRKTPMPKCDSHFTLRHVYSHVSLLRIFRASFPKNNSGRLLLLLAS